MKTIGILGKGGVGKTAIAINLACALGNMNKKVTLADLHLTTSHLSIELGMMPHTTLNDHIVHGYRLEDALHPQFNMFVIPSSLAMFSHEHARLDGIKEKMKESLGDFDYVILDSAPGIGKEAVSSMRASDEVVIVVNPTSASVADAIKLKQLAQQHGSNPIGVVVNKYAGKRYEIAPQDISELVELPILATIRDDEDFLRGQAAQTPMVFYNRGKSEDFFRLAAAVTGTEYSKAMF